LKKAIFIYNPLSGDHSIPGKLDYIIEKFQTNNTLIIPFRFNNFKEETLLPILQQPDIDYIIVSGGDGTVNYVSSLILKNNLTLPLGIIPSGTCNDFAESLNIPNNLVECLDNIIQGKIMKVDVGFINNEKYFLSTCAGGLFVDVSFNTHNELKKNFGPLAYYLKALSEVANIKPFNIKVKTEKESITQEALLFLILNGANGAGFPNLIKEADISDGLMDILIIKKGRHMDLAALFFKVLSNDFQKDKHITKLKAKTCTIESNSSITLSIDGEKGMNLPVKIEFLNKALQVFA
jgi:YegS/Rv2252/BmrU family lipid kinase